MKNSNYCDPKFVDCVADLTLARTSFRIKI